MAIIKGGSSGALADVDVTPKAQRSILYDAKGNPLDSGRDAAFAASVNVRQSATSAAGTIVWALRNTSATKIIEIDKTDLQCIFDGTAAATIMKYDIAKYTGVTATNGTAVTPVLKRTSQGAPVAGTEIKVLDTGLTLTNGVLQGVATLLSAFRVALATAAGSTMFETRDWTNSDAPAIELAQNEALAIRVAATAVIGDNILGAIEFSER